MDKTDQAALLHESLVWTEEANNLCVETAITRNMVRESLRRANTVFRPRSLEFLEECKRLKIPVIIVSAGYEVVIQEFLRFHSPQLLDNEDWPLMLIANELKFCPETDVVKGWGPLISPKNKEEMYVVYKEKWDATQQGRRHALVLGDRIGDLHPMRNVTKPPSLDPTIQSLEIMQGPW
eukprot:CAMPEP_0184309118 /NCGR_PEP_ID=MMETSP1049-20130417/17382_1 /TAXON_ID=77928 /ORGANISM="Proteomonas sulcata, Strain CCMP704" /LENGTH=178 /DNA_ID=CAMNT_0026621943 /DNA_START=174 /DNA_END=707 /DNA_ORIENTATION=+